MVVVCGKSKLTRISDSLPLCIQGMLEGTSGVQPEDVIIISGTFIDSLDELEALITDYQSSYWKADPQGGRKLCRILFLWGHVIQPRVLFPGQQKSPISLGRIYYSIDEYIITQERAGYGELMQMLFPNGPSQERLHELIARSIKFHFYQFPSL